MRTPMKGWERMNPACHHSSEDRKMLTSLMAIAALSFPADEPAIHWFSGSFEEARASAESEGKLLFTYFWANTPNCQQLYSQTMSDKLVIDQLNTMVCYSANVTETAPRAVFDSYGLATIPAMMASNAEGVDLEIMTGFMTPFTFSGEFNRIKNGINTIPDLRTRVELKYEVLEDEMVVRKMLADKLALMGKANQSKKMLEDIKALDFKNNTYTVALMRFNEIVTELTSASQDPAAWTFSSAEKFIKKLPKKNKRARFDSLTQLAGLQTAALRHSDALKTFGSAWKSRPADYNAIPSLAGIVSQLMSFPEELSPKDLKFARSVAYGALKYVEADHAMYCETKKCDGSDRECESYALDALAVTDGNNSGKFVAGRSTTNRSFIEFLIAQTENANGNTKKAIELMGTLAGENPLNTNFSDTLRRYENPDEEVAVAGSD